VRHARDEQPEAHAFGDPAPRGECRVPLEALSRSLAVHRLEVIETPDTVEAEVVGKARARRDLAPWHPLLRDVQTEPHRASSAESGRGSLLTLALDEQIDT